MEKVKENVLCSLREAFLAVGDTSIHLLRMTPWRNRNPHPDITLGEVYSDKIANHELEIVRFNYQDEKFDDASHFPFYIEKIGYERDCNNSHDATKASVGIYNGKSRLEFHDENGSRTNWDETSYTRTKDINNLSILLYQHLIMDQYVKDSNTNELNSCEKENSMMESSNNNLDYKNGLELPSTP